MLLNLQALNLDVRHGHGTKKHNSQEANNHLRLHATTKGMPSDQEGADSGNHREQYDDITIDPMEEDGLVPKDGHKLEAGEEAAREDSGEV